MAYNSPHRVLSRPVKVSWAGWVSDTARLQQAGWELSADEDVVCDRLRLAIRHRDYWMEGITHWYPEWGYYREQDRPLLPLGFRCMGSQVNIVEEGPVQITRPWKAIDGMPQISDRRVTRLEDLAHFAVPLVRTKALVMPDDKSVEDLLQMILEKQAPVRTEHFREEVLRDSLKRQQDGDISQHQRFHAQIITLKDAA